MSEPRRVTVIDYGDALGIDSGGVSPVDAALLLEEAAGVLLDYPDRWLDSQEDALVGVPPF